MLSEKAPLPALPHPKRPPCLDQSRQSGAKLLTHIHPSALQTRQQTAPRASSITMSRHISFGLGIGQGSWTERTSSTLGELPTPCELHLIYDNSRLTSSGIKVGPSMEPQELVRILDGKLSSVILADSSRQPRQDSRKSDHHRTIRCRQGRQALT